MKSKVLSFLIVTTLVQSSLFGEMHETWDFTAPDETPLTEAKSNLGTGFIPAASSIAAIRNNELEFSHDGTTQHTFRQTEFSGEPATKGVSEISWVFTKVDFSKTAAAAGSANVGFEVRDLKGTRQNSKDDLVLAGLRLRYDKNKIALQYKAHDAKSFELIHSIPVVKMEAPMQVRMRFDLDNPEAVGALKIYLKEGESEEFCALETATLPQSAVISGFRTAQQTINGKNSWQVGDVVCVDDFTHKVD
jgi:hypothetical protein